MQIHRQMHTSQGGGEGLLQPHHSSWFTPRSSRGVCTAQGWHNTSQHWVLTPRGESSNVEWEMPGMSIPQSKAQRWLIRAFPKGG